MDSPQSVVSPFRSSILGEGEKHKSDVFAQSNSPSSKEIEVNRKETIMSNADECVGVLDVYIHQARDIQNICIYHKQDVYAKICLTNNPENAVSTKTINGGGRNPVFNDNLRLNVCNVDSSLKCELWMLSRVKNYLEDQLLGFALVPLSEVLVQNGKLEKEFSLSSTDLFHSPSGFVQLSIAYTGATPDVMAISAMPGEEATRAAAQDLETSESLARDLGKIEFPDPKIANEDHLMVSEYFGISCEESQCSDSLANSDADNHSSEAGVRLVESFSACSGESVQVQPHKVVDFLVCLKSDVFVMTHGGNFAKLIIGARRYMGHRLKSIKPDKGLMSKSFGDPYMGWAPFVEDVIVTHQTRTGLPEETFPNYDLWENPLTPCMCKA